MKSKGPPKPRSAVEVVLASLSPVTGKRLLDCGCGSGELAVALAGLGAVVSGIDPEGGAVALARKRCPGADFRVGIAQMLPFEPGSFDAVVMVNSLHHVPVEAMAQALHEARRVLAIGGHLIVVEPEARGSFFEAMRPIEDETTIRAAAQEALSDAVLSGLWEGVCEFAYVRTETFSDVDAFIVRVVAVDPSRQAIADLKFGEINAAFRRASKQTGDGRYSLDQPIVARALAPSSLLPEAVNA